MDAIPEPLQAAIQTRLRERRTFGLAVCCFDTDGIRFAGGVGDADLGRGEAVTAHTIFRVASISKLVTTALLLTAVDHGLIDLDAPINRYLPTAHPLRDRDGNAASSTVRTLLSHTSGLGSGARGADVGNPVLSYVANQGRVRTLEDAIRGLRLRNAPGDRIEYSNPGFNLAGHLAATAWGTSFEDAARAHVLEPTGMLDAFFAPNHHGVGRATPYGTVVPPGVGPEPATRMRLVATPMGGLSVNVLDLARFGRMILNGGVADGRRVLPRALVTEATTLQVRNHPDLEQGYGLGFRVRQWRGRTLVAHDGNMPGVAAQLQLSPADGVGVVVVTNGFSLGLPHEIAALSLEQALGLPSTPTSPPAGVDRAAAEAFGRRVAGSYRLDDPPLPGLPGRIAGLQTRVRVTHETGGRLRLDGNPGSDGPAWLQPEGPRGRYRLHASVDHLTNAVIEERPDGTHLWLAHYTHLRRRP